MLGAENYNFQQNIQMCTGNYNVLLPSCLFMSFGCSIIWNKNTCKESRIFL